MISAHKMQLKLFSLVFFNVLVLTAGTEYVRQQQVHHVNNPLQNFLALSTGLIRSTSQNILQQVQNIEKHVERRVLNTTNVMMNQALSQLIQMVREGLAHAHVENISLPTVNWTIKSPDVSGTIQTMNARLLGLTNFAMRTLSSNLTQLNMDIDVLTPLIEVQGDYIIDIKLYGFPISGKGSFSAKFSGLQFGAEGHLQNLNLLSLGRGASLEILNFGIGLGGIDIVFEGLPSSNFGTNLILIGVGSLTLYTAIIVLSTLLVRNLVTLCWGKFRRRDSPSFSDGSLK